MQFFFNFGGAPDIVQYVHHRFGGGFDDIRRQPDAVEAATMMVYDDIDLTQRVFALAFGVQVVFNQLNVVASDAVNRLIASTGPLPFAASALISSPQASFTEAVAISLEPDCTLK